MPPVETVHVIVEAKARIVVAELPVTRCRDTVLHAAVMQHRQIEAAAVPRDELGRRALEAVEEAPEDLLLGLAFRAEAEDMHVARRLEHRRYRDDPMHRQRQEIALARLLLLEMHDSRNVGVVEVRQAVVTLAQLHVRYGLDVENQHVHVSTPRIMISATAAKGRTQPLGLVRRSSTATASTRPASSVSVR